MTQFSKFVYWQILQETLHSLLAKFFSLHHKYVSTLPWEVLIIKITNELYSYWRRQS